MVVNISGNLYFLYYVIYFNIYKIGSCMFFFKKGVGLVGKVVEVLVVYFSLIVKDI